MAPKSQSRGGNTSNSNSKSSNQGKKQTEEAQEDGLAAVILTDSYHSMKSDPLQPLSNHQPTCLLPFLNSTLLDWTLETLSLANVETVYILSKRGFKEIKHLLTSNPDKYSSQFNHFGFQSIQLIPVPEIRSLGDAMRELDSKQIIRSDFILCHADTVANLDLESIVKTHKQRRLLDKDAIMTVCSVPTPKASPNRSSPEESIHFISPSNSQLLHYETSSIASPFVNHNQRNRRPSPSCKLPLELLLASEKDGGVSEIEIRNDLVESGFYVCSIDVPPLFTENFDYQNLSTDFIPGILTSDLLDSKIFLHISPSSPHSTRSLHSSSPVHAGWGYASRVKDTKSYDLIAKNVLSRWTFPLTPGANCPGGIEYSVRNGMRYVGKDVRLSRTSTFGPLSLIGPETSVSDDSKILKSTLGSQVAIGRHCTISNSHLWSKVKVGNHCSIEKSIIGRNVVLLDNVKVERGCLIADDCVIGPNVTLEKFSRVARIKEKEARKSLDDDEDDEEQEQEATAKEKEKEEKKDAYSKEKLGSQSVGFLWSSTNSLGSKQDGDDDEEEEGDDDDEDEDDIEEEGFSSKNQIFTRLGYTLTDHLGFLETQQQQQRGDEEISSNESLSSLEFDSDLMTDSESESESQDGEDQGGKEALSAATLAGDLLSSFTNNASSHPDSHSNPNSDSSKLKEFKSEALASLSRALEENHTVDNAAIELKTLRMASNVPLREVRKIVVEFFLEKFSVDDPKKIAELLDRWGGLIEIVSADDQVEALGLVQSYCAIHHQTHSKLFVPLLKKFYNDDLISDDSILSWWKSPVSRDTSKANGGEKILEMRKSAEGVVRHVLESQQESEEEEEEKEDEEE